MTTKSEFGAPRSRAATVRGKSLLFLEASAPLYCRFLGALSECKNDVATLYMRHPNLIAHLVLDALREQGGFPAANPTAAEAWLERTPGPLLRDLFREVMAVNAPEDPPAGPEGPRARSRP